MELVCRSKHFSSDEYEIESPLERTRLTSAIATIGTDVGNPFKHDLRNHYAYLLLPLGLTIIRNGNHSSACGTIKGEGHIEVTAILDNCTNYKNFYFDGEYIHKYEDKKLLIAVNHFEYGVLFEIGRLIQEHGIAFIPSGSLTKKENPPPKIIDREWRIYPRNGRNILHYYSYICEGECEVSIYGNTVIFTTMAESFGTSTTNVIEDLATWVADKYSIPLPDVICYQHYIEEGIGWTRSSKAALLVFLLTLLPFSDKLN